MPHAADLAVKKLQNRIDNAVQIGQAAAQQRTTDNDEKQITVAFAEWTEPIFIGGHWTPQIIAMAGATHPLNPATLETGAGKSFVVTGEALLECDPDFLIIGCCGLDIPTIRKEMPSIMDKPWWKELSAVKNKRVWIVDGNQMFNRPGPRLVDALEWLVSVFHDVPDMCPKDFPAELLL